MQSLRVYTINRKILAILLAFSLIAGMLCFGNSHADAKGSLSTGDSVKTVLVYAKNSAGDEVLISQLKVSDMLTYLNDNIETYGKIHNYSILDSYVTPVHQEAQGFTVKEMLDYAKEKSSLEKNDIIGLDFAGNDSVSFWEIDGGGFDAADTYTYNSLYGVNRYNFPALYGNWDYIYKAYADKDAIWNSGEEARVILSITAYSQRYIVSALNGTGNYNMENYFDGQGLLDTARSVRIMLPMTEDEFENQTPTAMNSRWGICYILLDMVTKPDFSLGEVAKPTYTLIDGDESDSDEYEAGYWYFTLECETPGATIYYNDNSQSNYMPTAVYSEGQAIKVKKSATSHSIVKFRAVKDGYSDAGVQTASSNPEKEVEEVVDPNANVWDGTSVDTSWYDAGQANFTISTAAELAGLAALVNNSDESGAVDFTGKTITLANHIHLNARAWEPIGTDMGRRSSSNPKAIDNDYYYVFRGIFDGAGHTISGINVNYLRATGSYSGLFGKLENAAIKNLTTSGSVYSYIGRALGGVAGRADSSTFENCINKARVENGSGSIVGGIVGTARGTSGLVNCVNYGTITGEGHMGGIVGEAVADTSIKDCLNYGSVTGRGIGGKIGGISGTNGLISGCANYARVVGNSSVGGIVGEISSFTAGIDDCINLGAVIAISGYAGGITGCILNSRQGIKNCMNFGAIDNPEDTSAYNGAGGICGDFSTTMTACANYGNVSAKKYVGGLVSYLRDSKANLNNSYNHGKIVLNSGNSTTSYCGGIAGFVADSNKHIFSKCYDVSGGAVFGSVSTSANISKVYYLEGGIEIGAQPNVDRFGIDSKTAVQMKKPSFLTTLGQYNANGNGTDDGYYVVNSGSYPVLYWQQKAVSFDLTPADAAVAVKNSDGTVVAANPDGSYTLILGETYTYEVTAEDYLSKTGSFTVKGAETLRVALNKDKIVTDGPSQIILSWSDNPSTTQSVIWCDNSGNDEYVQYLAESSYTDESSFNNTKQVQATSKTVGYESAATTYYEATMTGLVPGTKYYYRVGRSDNWSDPSSFTTAPSSTSSFSFMYMGDVQHNTTAAAEYPVWGSLLTDAYAANPNITFGLMGGDMVESGSDMNDWTYFLSYAGDVFSRIPMMTTIGNHESNFTGGKAKYYMDILALPTNGPVGFEEEFYSFDYGTVHVTVLNSWALSSEQNLDDAQKNAISEWIRADLAAAGNAKFRIILLHHPAYALANDTVSASVLSNWVPLLEAGNVDLVLCGHQHVYSRSYPMLAGEIYHANGITYVMGNSGQKFYSTADTAYQEKTIFSKSTYQIININGNTLSLSTFDSAGNLLDSWSTTTQSTILIGDVDGDGDVDLDDVNAIYRAVLNCDDYNSLMDINNDGVVDMRDTQLVLKIHLDNAA